ncbi:RNA-binding S4 domain-containing protein [Nitratiruptor sp. SB155-2]|uniref:RNA-binding S4 domain-containing protein n=1 Tax=Nitratiruptor sp. (strain SB155-2) TaxID=387092 RepID=UPI000158700B|nr:RNA-binding S4 domain-containing protein [Nitratiruptor sp. SB155-2]BAF69960.1 RNA-binding S4 protein [Nitratiruptor sp. SB155-2]
MRIDKFMNAVNIVKRRSVAQDMIKNEVVLLNGLLAKASKDVKIGDIITIKYLKGDKSYKVLAIPTTKNVPKARMSEYVEEI